MLLKVPMGSSESMGSSAGGGGAVQHNYRTGLGGL